MEKLLIDNELKQISELFAKKQFAGLDKKITSLLNQLDPEDPEDKKNYIQLRLLMIDLLFRSKKLSLAISELEKEIIRFPYHPELLSKGYEFYLLASKFADASACLRLLIILEPNNFLLRINQIKLIVQQKDYLTAISEINKLINFGYDNIELYMLLINLLGQEEMYSDQYEKIKMLQKLLPDDISLIFSEIDILTKLGRLSDIAVTVNGLLSYLLESGKPDDHFINLLQKYAQLYLRMGYKDLLARIFIRVFAGHFSDLSDQNKQKLEKLAKEVKLSVIYHFFCNAKVKQKSQKSDLRFIITNDKMDSFDILENIVLMCQNSECLIDTDFTIREFLEKTELIKLIPRDLSLFLPLLENSKKEQ